MIFVFVIFAAVGLAVASNWWRSNLRADFLLMPNCLMTRSPLVFVSGWRSPFYFINYWNGIPHYLREHGYEVVELDLPWRDSSSRQQELSLFLEAAKNQDLTFHFIFDSAGTNEATRLNEWKHSSVRSVTLATPEYFGWSHRLEGSHFQPSYTLKAIFSRFAALCHQFYLPSELKFSPAAAGLPFAAPRFTAEKEFLRLAISLAEKEMKVAHNLAHDVHQ